MYQLAKFHLVLRDIDLPEILRKTVAAMDTGLTGAASSLACFTVFGFSPSPGKVSRWRLQ